MAGEWEAGAKPGPPKQGDMLNGPRRLVTRVNHTERTFRCDLWPDWNAPACMGATVEPGWTELEARPLLSPLDWPRRG